MAEASIRIDSHQHFWHYEPVKHAWINEEMAEIRRDYLPVHLEQLLKENTMDGCVAVQADQTTRETDFLIDLATKNSFIKGVVGWVDLRSDKLTASLEHYSQYTMVKGFRHVVQDETDPEFMLRSKFSRGIAQLEQFGYTYDVLVFPHQLVQTLEFVKKHPSQKFVIDHMAKPYIKSGYVEGWAVMLKEIAKCKNVYCKLSGMVTEAAYRTWQPSQFYKYMNVVLNAFGAERLMFGSDWPVCLVAGSYGEVKQLVVDFIAELSPSEQQGIMGGNAVNFYGL